MKKVVIAFHAFESFLFTSAFVLNRLQIMTATVETVSEQLDLAAIIPSEKVVSAVARAITLSESDVGKNLVNQIYV